MIKNLVFKGGGVLGIAYAGAITEMEANGTLAGVERVAGTSAGAITACLLALRYDAKEILDIVKSTDFKTFEDPIKPIEGFERFGLHSGNAFMAWIKQIIVGKGYNENMTFADLHNMGGRDLHVFASDITSGGLKRFSYADTPNVVIAEAVRASMSIPFFFEEYNFVNSIPDNHIYVDGGAVYNYPLTSFDLVGVNPETLGLFLINLSGAKPIVKIKPGHVLAYARAVEDVVLEAQNIELATNKEEMHRTVMIDSLGISATNFGLSDDQKTALYQAGRDAYLNYFKSSPLYNAA